MMNVSEEEKHCKQREISLCGESSEARGYLFEESRSHYSWQYLAIEYLNVHLECMGGRTDSAQQPAIYSFRPNKYQGRFQEDGRMSQNTSTASTKDEAAAAPAAKAEKSQATAKDRKEEAKRLIMQYFKQLTEGCDNNKCSNAYCASSSGLKKLSKKEALKKAIGLARRKTKPPLCKPCTTDSSSAKNSTGATGSSSKPEVKESTVETLQLSAFEKAIKEADSCSQANGGKPDYKIAIRMIGNVFGNDIALSSSFTLGSELKVTEKDSGVDLKAVTEFYNLVEKADLTTVLNDTIDRFTQSVLYKPMRKEAPLLELRKYLILLENPAFLDPDSHLIFRRLGEIIFKLPKERKDILVNWFANYSPSQMEELIGRIQQYITVRWYTNRAVEDLKRGTIVLELLYRANELWMNHQLHVYDEDRGFRSPRRRGPTQGNI
eukprot:335539-Amorphochlora_amoeboformis.AAC.1